MKFSLSLAALAMAALGLATVTPVHHWNFEGNPNGQGFATIKVGTGTAEYRNVAGTGLGSPKNLVIVEELIPGLGFIPYYVARFDKNDFFRANHTMGVRTAWTLLYDVKWTGLSTGFISLFQTASANNNDGDYFLRATGTNDEAQFGIGGSYAGTPVKVNEWNRIVVSIQTTGTTTTFNSYVNGTLYRTQTQSANARWNTEAGFLGLLLDNDQETQSGWMLNMALFDRALTADEVSLLGGVNQGGIFSLPVPEPATLIALAAGLGFLARRRARRS